MHYFLLFILSFSVFGTEYSFDKIEKIERYNIDEKIYQSNEHVMLILNNENFSCRNNRCYPFERKINYLAPQINARGIKIYNMNVSYNQFHLKYGIKKLPAVIFFSSGSFMKLLEPNTCSYYERNNDCRMRNLTWVNSLLQSSLDSLNQIFLF